MAYQRPENFIINPGAPLAKGLVFAGLGRTHGTGQSVRYRDESRSFSYPDAGNHGTLTNFTGGGDTPKDKWQWIPALGRWGLGFDGTDDYVLRTYTPAVLSQPVTMACWFKVPSFPGNKEPMTLGTYNGASGNTGFWMTLQSNSTVGAFENTGATTAVASTTLAATINTWSHGCCMWITSASRKSYLNGGNVGVDTTSLPAQSNIVSNAFIGARWRNNVLNNFVSGTLVDTMIWNRVLSPAEISSLANPSNVLLRSGGVDLVQPLRRRNRIFTGSPSSKIKTVSSIPWASISKVAGLAAASIKSVGSVAK